MVIIFLVPAETGFPVILSFGTRVVLPLILAISWAMNGMGSVGKIEDEDRPDYPDHLQLEGFTVAE